MVAFGVHGCGGFIKDEQVGSSDEGEREQGSLLLSAGKSTPGGVLSLGEAEQLNEFAAGTGILVVSGREGENLSRIHGRPHSAALQESAYPTSDRVAIGEGVFTHH
jgi:hypothetical protein